MADLFAYGTLMCSDIMTAVSGCLPDAVPATLRGYRRCPVKNEHYPALIADPGSNVTGIVYRDVPDFAWERLDRFEGAMYLRCGVEPETDDGSLCTAQTYVARPAYHHLLQSHEWDFREFLENFKARFQRGYQGFQALAASQDGDDLPSLP